MRIRDGKGLSAGRPSSFGIIGTGEIVRMVLPTLNQCDKLGVVAIAGRNDSAANALGKEFGGVAVYSDYRDLLLDLKVDAVYIATPPHLHLEMLMAALEAGKHVVCEKPLIMSLGELHEVLAAHRRCATLKVASCSSRFLSCPPVRRARELVAKGRLGKILRVRLNNSSEWPRPFKLLPAWKRSATTSGGGLGMDWGVYDLDWLQYLLGELFDPIAVMGSVDYWQDEGTGLETGYAANILCRDGLTITLERRPEQGPRFQRAEIRGTDGGLDLPFMPAGEPEQLTSYSYLGGETLHGESLPEKMNDWGTILAFPIIDLAEALAEKREVASPLSIQMKIYAVIAALYESSKLGRSVTVSHR